MLKRNFFLSFSLGFLQTSFLSSLASRTIRIETEIMNLIFDSKRFFIHLNNSECKSTDQVNKKILKSKLHEMNNSKVFLQLWFYCVLFIDAILINFVNEFTEIIFLFRNEIHLQINLQNVSNFKFSNQVFTQIYLVNKVHTKFVHA